MQTPILRDGWNELRFEPVRTHALRLEFTAQEGFSAGVLAWEVH